MSVEARARITNPTGLHARPAVKLAQLAARFKADVRLRIDDGDWVPAKSTAKILKLKARVNAILQFRAEGEDAPQALSELVAFVERDFDDRQESAPLPASVAAVPASARRNALDFTGATASAGVGFGPLYRLPSPMSAVRPPSAPGAEKHAFDGAIAATHARLRALAGGGKLETDIIAFQIALLDDAEFLAPIRADIAAGATADSAWNATMVREIAGYEHAEDGYFRGRAADLRDLQERVAAVLSGAPPSLAAPPDGAILVTEEITPSRFLELDWNRLGGAAMTAGSEASHVAMLARACGVPLLVKLRADLDCLEWGAPAILAAADATGRLIVHPDAATQARYCEAVRRAQADAETAARHLPQPAHSADGERILLYLNVDDPAALAGLDPTHCDGIGLTRTEFLFQTGLADEDRQYHAYRRLLEWARGRPVTIRTLDAGGDKPIPGFTPAHEDNPFLGVRGIRLSLARPEVFRTQLRALARAAAHGPLKVMLPMVTLPEELLQTRVLLQAEAGALARAGIAAAMPALGAMVEVPAAALTIDHFAADFLSIGSNDLIQYLMAAGRDNATLAYLQNPLHPALLELITRVAHHGSSKGLEVSVCGEMAAQPQCLAALLNAGIRALSVPPAALGRIKAALAATKIHRHGQID